MSAESTLYSLLTAGSPANPVVTIVGTVIYPLIVPQGKSLPAIAYQRVSTEYVNVVHFTDAVARRATFDIFCVSNGFLQAESLADAVEGIDGLEKLDRSSTYDVASETFATIVTVRLMVVP